MLQHARPLSDSQLDTRPVLDGRDKDFSRLVEVVAGAQQGIDMHAVSAPRFDLVEVAPVGVDRIVSLFVGPIAHTPWRADPSGRPGNCKGNLQIRGTKMPFKEIEAPPPGRNFSTKRS
jgi:hypothetical protein